MCLYVCVCAKVRYEVRVLNAIERGDVVMCMFVYGTFHVFRIHGTEVFRTKSSEG